MTDSITDEDVRRVDRNVDPTALTDDDIAEELPDDFSSTAKDAFSERVAAERDAVRESVDLSDRIAQNPATGEAMVKNEQGQFAASATKVTGTRVESDGAYVAELDDGGEVRVDTVDLQAGAEGTRSSGWD